MRKRIPTIDEFIIEKKQEYKGSFYWHKLMHFAKNKKERDEYLQNLMKDASWSKSDAEYSFNKFRKEIEYKGPEFYEVGKQFTYDQISDPKSKYREFERLHLPDKHKIKPVKWNEKRYNEWIKDMAAEGTEHAYDLAQNANHEPGLIDYVKTKIKKWGGDEEPLERIAWDIESQE